MRNRANFFGRFSPREPSPERAVDEDEGEAIKGARQVCSDEVVVRDEGLADELGKRALAEEIIVSDVWSPSRMPTPKRELTVQQQVREEGSD